LTEARQQVAALEQQVLDLRQELRQPRPAPGLPVTVRVEGRSVVNGRPTTRPLKEAVREAAVPTSLPLAPAPRNTQRLDACPWCAAAGRHAPASGVELPHLDPAEAARGAVRQLFACGAHFLNVYPSPATVCTRNSKASTPSPSSSNA
jgi:hypothetical protein